MESRPGGILCPGVLKETCYADFAHLSGKNFGGKTLAGEINYTFIKIKFWTKGRIRTMKILTAPSIFASDLLEIGSQVRRTQDSGADILHFDIMDGVYAVSYTHLDVYKRQLLSSGLNFSFASSSLTRTSLIIRRRAAESRAAS